LAVGNCACVVAVREGLGEGLDFSVTPGGDDFGLGPGLTVVRRCAFGSDGVTVRPGVVTVSEVAVVVVVVVV
jgi:hypothetical protein